MTELSAPYLFEYTYRRSVGPVIGRFLAGLREGRFEGVRTAAGKVLVPPAEYDEHGEAVLDAWAAVGPEGTVTRATWEPAPRPRQPLARPFSWALVVLDGADTAILHAVDGRVAPGARVRPRWRTERVGAITDLECFEPCAS